MVGINFLNYLDRWVASAAAPLIQKEFHIDDAQVGLLGTAFLLVYAVAALPFGYWGDRGVRRTVIGVGVTIWSLATLFSGLAANYVQLFLSRGAVGIGEASYYPAGTSLVSDYFPKEQRGRAMSIWGAGSAVGIAVGFAGGGFVADRFGWRSAFYFAAVPGLLFAFLAFSLREPLPIGSAVGIAVGFAGGGFVADRFGWRSAFYFAAVPGLLFAFLAFSLREPLRGSMEKLGPTLRRTTDASTRTFINLMRIPTLRAAILAQTVLYFVLASNAFWLPTLLHRRFDMSLSAAGLLAGVVLVVGGLIGTLSGGWIADRRAKTRPAAHLEVGIAGFLIGAVFIIIALVAPLSIGPVPVFVPAFLVTVIAIYLHAGPFTAVSQNVVSPALRASS